MKLEFLVINCVRSDLSRWSNLGFAEKLRSVGEGRRMLLSLQETLLGNSVQVAFQIRSQMAVTELLMESFKTFTLQDHRTQCFFFLQASSVFYLPGKKVSFSFFMASMAIVRDS